MTSRSVIFSCNNRVFCQTLINECPDPQYPKIDFLSQVDGDNCTFTYKWDFGDGYTSTSSNSTHEFKTTGTFVVNLTVGCKECRIQKSDSIQILIEEGRTLASIERDYRSMIASARAFGWNVAADNLAHFISATDGSVNIASAWLQGFSEIRDAVATNQQRFESLSLQPEITAITPGQTKTVNDHWDRLVSTSPLSGEIFYASGNSTVTSTGSFTIHKSASGDVTVTGTVTHSWHDPYDFHPGLAAPIPGFGNVKDDDAVCLVNTGRAANFDMTSSWTQTLTFNSSSNSFVWSN